VAGPGDPHDDPVTHRKAVGTRVARGLAWTAVGSAGSNAMRLVVLLALGRLLAPSEFGIVAKAITVLVFVKVIGDLGLGGALVQHRQPTDAHVRTAFTVSLILALVLAGLVLLLAPQLARLYRSDDLTPYLQAIAALIAIRGLGSVALQMCRREMDFRTTTLSEVAGYLIGSTASIVFAALGIGAWALVWGYLIEAVVSTAILLARYPIPRALGVDRGALRELLRFGSGETVSQLASMLATQGDYFVVGRYLGASPLGFYTRAYELVRFPANTFNSVVGTVLFPAMSRLQDDRPGLADGFRRALFTTAFVLMPASALLFVLAPEFLRVVLGEGWDHAVLPFQIMVCGMAVRTSYKIGALVVRARGDTYAIAATQVLYAIAVIGGAALSVRWGITGVAASTTAAMFLLFIALTWLGMKRCDLRLGTVLGCHALPAIATAIVGVITLGAAHGTRMLAWSSFSVFSASAGAGVLGFLIVTRVGLARRHRDLRWSFDHVRALLHKLSPRSRRTDERSERR
jgi:O-antigen/teichoic acid export membrane protein